MRTDTTPRPILVTGSHRSGTTWIGRMLALAPRVGYIHEPFNPLTPPGICAAPFDHFFTYVTTENEGVYYAPLSRTFAFSYDLRAELAAVRTPRDVATAAQSLAAFQRARLRHARPLIKDPIAVFSTEWLAERFGMDVLVVVRHPAAFAASLKRLDWRHDFRHFLAEQLLMRDHLHPYAEEIRRQADVDQGVVAQAATLWRLIYGTILRLRQRHPEWILIRHEDASRDPESTFLELYGRLGLAYTARAQRAIAAHSAPSNPTASRSRHDVRLASAASLDNWRHVLTKEEAAFVRASVGDLAGAFYDDGDW
ncbi:MAG: hypothetical protein C5B48_01045 [Candidatus Rokuibacteriota bacterium]|nr:MAG: hypothetical protein C5B48_01045 [Candidatus Rokubacteria bacterium]